MHEHKRYEKMLSKKCWVQNQLWTDFLQNGLVGSPCSPRSSQESSPTPHFKNINSLVLSFLHSPTLTSIHDHWKNQSLDQMDLCWKSNISAFEYAIQVGHTFLPRSKRLLISWLQSPSALILEPRKIKSDTVSTVSPSISHEVMLPAQFLTLNDQLCLSLHTVVGDQSIQWQSFL